ncbi:MAG: hypothetical protein ACFE8J_04835 [Candidatus Heimdallarchaeota archaeon]
MRLGPILITFGSLLIFLNAWLLPIMVKSSFEADLSSHGLSWEDIGFKPEIFNVSIICTVLWGIIGLIGAILSITGKKSGNFLSIIVGILVIIGVFIPIGKILTWYVSLSYTFFFIEPTLFLLGGIFGLFLKE